MATNTIERQIVLAVPPTLIGPESEYEKARLALRSEHLGLVAEAQKITVVTTQEDLNQANSAGRVLQVASKECETFFKPIKVQIDSLKKPILAHENEISSAIEAEKKRLGQLITKYNQEQERIRQEAERAAREAAEAAERERLLQMAVDAEASGDTATAEAILEEPVVAPPVVIQSTYVKPAGQVGSVRYSCTVENLMTLIRAVAEGKAPIGCVMANESYLNNRARDDKENFSIPGCKLNRNTSTHFRS